MLHAICWRDHGEKERCAKSVRNIITAFSEMPAEDVFRNLKNYLPRSIFGSPEELIETIIKHGGMRVFINKDRKGYFQMIDDTYSRWGRQKIKKQTVL